MTDDQTFQPKYLGKHVSGPIDEVDLVPWKGGEVTVRLECTEFTSICPVTGQPDFGELLIEYVPDGSIIETKSLKLFLQGYRDRRGFNEAIVDDLATRLADRLAPTWLRVTGSYNLRGGIGVTCTAERGTKTR